jgi:hypothetical protein
MKFAQPLAKLPFGVLSVAFYLDLKEENVKAPADSMQGNKGVVGLRINLHLFVMRCPPPSHQNNHAGNTYIYEGK